VEELDTAGQRDEHGDKVWDQDEVVMTGAGGSHQRENKGVLPKEFVIIHAGCCQFCVLSRPGVCKVCRHVGFFRTFNLANRYSRKTVFRMYRDDRCNIGNMAHRARSYSIR
jgi:hypothetical protein